MAKKDCWDKTHIVGMLFLTALIALGTLILALKEAPEIRESLENLTISRGRCLTPNIIYGRVTYNGNPVSNAEVTMRNINTGDSKNVVTDESGSYLESVGNFPNCWIGGDRIKIDSCISNKCGTKEIVFSLEGGGIEVNVEI